MNSAKIKNLIVSNQRFLKLLWIILFALLAIIPYIYSILYAPISIDGSYYLSMVERIRDGLVPYHDFTVEYTPLFFYITAFVKNLFAVGINYGFDLGFHFCIQLIVTVLLYKIAVQMAISKWNAYHVAVFYLLISYWITQYEFILEIPSLLWGCWAIYLALRYQHKFVVFILIGMIASLSFLTKQYGLGFFFLILYLIDYNSNRWKQMLFFIIGYIIPILFFKLKFPEIATVFLGNGYGLKGTEQPLGIFWYNMIKRMLEASGYFLFRVPILLFAIVLIKRIPRKQQKNAWFLMLGIAGFMMQFIFAIFNHYGLYIIPFASLFIFLIFTYIPTEKWLYKSYIALLILVFGAAIFKNYARAFAYDHNSRTKQILLAEKIKQNMDPGKTLYIADTRLVDLYYPLNVKPAGMRYTFGLTMTEKLHYRQMRVADYILTYNIPDSLNFNYLNSKRVQWFLKTISDKTIIDNQYFVDKKTHKTMDNQVLLFKNNHLF
jgi:hypothetical protein